MATRPTASSSKDLDAALTRFQAEIDAVAVGISVGDGALSKNISRSASASRLLTEVWEHGAAGLMEQARASTNAIGTNKLRGVANGPVCGKLIAAALRDADGVVTGLVIALRTVEQEKFTLRESQKITELAGELVTLLKRKVPEPPAGLMSWSVFEERATAQERAATASGCVLYGNVDQLHVLNKLAGFAVGDRAIAAVGDVLNIEKNLPSGAGACHLSGDRFVIYLPATALPQARKIAEQLCRAVSDRISKLDGLRTKLSISFGVAAVPESDSGVSQALAAAEAACRAAKERGRGRVEVYQDADQSIARRNDEVAIAGRLRKALEAQRFSIVAQPLHRLQGGGEPDCYELLIRIADESGTLVSAGTFMPAAKRYQLLAELDHVVITRVFDLLKAVRHKLHRQNVRYSINLSGPTIADDAFLEWLLLSIGPDGVPGEWLQFELTESAAVANVSQTQTLIRKLRALGVEFALDDFGTGVSSFSYLKTFDVSTLKLDGSFTRDLLIDTRSEALVRGIAQLGRGMGIQTVAECVETQAVRDRLKELGIDRAQGFFYGQPVPFERVLEEQVAAAATLTPAHAEQILAAAEVVVAPLSAAAPLAPAMAPVDSELLALVKSTEELVARSEELKVATGQVIALSEQLERTTARAPESDATVEQPVVRTVARTEQADATVEHVMPALRPDGAVEQATQSEPTAEQPHPTITAAG